MSIILTENAAKKFKELLVEHNEPDGKLRVWVAGIGCSGFKYGMGISADKPEEGDAVFETEGTTVIVDSASLSYIDGSTIDYDANGFSVNNPNEPESSCGDGCSSCSSSEAN